MGPGREDILLVLVLVEGVEVTVDLVEGSDLTEAVDTGSFLISVVPEEEAVSAARMASATISFFLLTSGADEEAAV